MRAGVPYPLSEERRFRIEVLERLALMGPNWKIDLGALDERPTNTLPGFAEACARSFPR